MEFFIKTLSVNFLVVYMFITLIVLFLSAVFFIQGKLRSDLVALCALVLLMLFDILTPTEALSGFSNSVVIMMIGLFVVGGAIFQTGLAKKVSSKMLEFAGNSELKLLILIMLVTSFIGAFVSNTGTVALMLPIVVSMAMNSKINPSRLLMPLAFASSMGGMLTLIGTPPNLVIQETLVNAGYPSLSFFSYTPVGIVSIIVGVLLLIPLSKKFLLKAKKEESDRKKHKSVKELANEYQLFNNLYRVQVTNGSFVRNKNIQELDIAKKYDISILEIRRREKNANHFFKTISQKIVAPDTVILSDDILYLLGGQESIEKFVSEQKLRWMDSHVLEEQAGRNHDFHEIGIAEVLLMPNSKLINQQVKDCGFREKFRLNILGIQRKETYILQNLKDEKLQSGDMILVQGSWNNIARLGEDQSEWVVLGQPLAEAAKVTIDHKAPTAAFVMLLMIVAMVFDLIPAVVAVIVAGVLMVLTGCLRNVEEAYKTINWESIVLIAAMLPMSTALEKTGVSSLVSDSLASGLGTYGPLILLAGVYFTTSLLTMFISNTATAVLVAPIALSAAIQIGVSPYPFLFAVSVAASMCFASPFSTPPNALVMSAGKYSFMDYVKVGLPLQILMGIVMVLMLPLLFPF